jgi:hypothetical protein
MGAGEAMRVRVTPERGDAFTGEVSGLGPESLFLKTDRPLAFRDVVRIDLENAELRGEVVYVSPLGAGIVFHAPPEVRARIVELATNRARARGASLGAVAPALGARETPRSSEPPAGSAQEEIERELRAYVEGTEIDDEPEPSEPAPLPHPSPPEPSAVEDLPPSEARDPSSPPASESFADDAPDPAPISLRRQPLEASLQLATAPPPPVVDPEPEVRPARPRSSSRIPRPTSYPIEVKIPELEGARFPVSSRMDAFAACATMLGGRSLIARAPDGPTIRAVLVFGEVVLDLYSASIGNDLVALDPIDRQAVERAARQLLPREITGDLHPEPPVRPATPPLESGPPPPVSEPPAPAQPTGPMASELPVLEDGDVVRFESLAQFATQYRLNIAQAAIVVRAKALPLGATKRLKLLIPKVEETVTFEGRVQFGHDNLVGFAIDDLAAQKATLIRILSGVGAIPAGAAGGSASSTPASGPNVPLGRSSSVTASPHPIPHESQLVKPGATFKTKMKTPGEVRAVVDIAERPAQSLEDCGGWFIRILDLFLRVHDAVVVTFRRPDKKLAVWIQGGRVVFTKLDPTPETDLIGHRLVTDKRITLTRRTLEQALERQRSMHEPIGRTLIAIGALPQSAVHSALRNQTIDRIMALREWDHGEIEVTPWVEPSVQGDLVGAAGRPLIADLLREHLRALPNEEIERFIQPSLDQPVQLTPNHVEASLLLNQRERRALEVSAPAKPMLRTMGSASGLNAVTAARLVILAKTLGVIEIVVSNVSGDVLRDQALIVSLKEEIAVKERASLFEVLGLHWTCMPADVPPAHQARVREVKDHRRSKNQEIQRLANKLAEMADSAFKLLSDTESRKAARAKTADAGERRSAAELMLDQAESLVTIGDFQKAQQLLTTAQEICPTDRGRELRDQLSL